MATSKPHTPARADSPHGWQLSSHLHQAKETAPVGTGKLFQPTVHHQAAPNNCLCLRLSESGSGAEELQYKMLVSRSKPWGQYTNLQLTITKDRQSSLWYTDVSFHLIPVHKIMPNTFKKCFQAFPSFTPFHMGLVLHCSAQAEIFHHKREYMNFFYLLSLKGGLAKY